MKQIQMINNRFAFFLDKTGIATFLESKLIEKASYGDCIESGLYTFHDLGLVTVPDSERSEILVYSQVKDFKGYLEYEKAMALKLKNIYCTKYYDGVNNHIDILDGFSIVPGKLEELPINDHEFEWYEIKIDFNQDKSFIVSRCKIAGNKSPYYKEDKNGPDF